MTGTKIIPVNSSLQTKKSGRLFSCQCCLAWQLNDQPHFLVVSAAWLGWQQNDRRSWRGRCPSSWPLRHPTGQRLTNGSWVASAATKKKGMTSFYDNTNCLYTPSKLFTYPFKTTTKMTNRRPDASAVYSSRRGRHIGTQAAIVVLWVLWPKEEQICWKREAKLRKSSTYHHHHASTSCIRSCRLLLFFPLIPY